MNPQQLTFFHQRLTTLRDELRDKSENTLHHLRDNTPASDPADRATLEEEQTFELRIRDRERKLLAKVEAALLRIEHGEYGYCEESGEPIGLQRLLARPTTTFSIEAQVRREKWQRIYADN